MNLASVLDRLESGDVGSLDQLDAEDWEQLARAIRHGAVNGDVLKKVAAACAGRPAAIPVLSELTSDPGLSLAIARALLREDSVDQLGGLLDETGLRDAYESEGPPERMLLPLSRLLADPRAWMWAARGLVTTSVAALPELVRDTDAEVRLLAVRSLGATSGDAATEALFIALHDNDEAVQQGALAALQARCETDAGLRERLDREVGDLTQLAEASPTKVQALVRRIPGLPRLMSALRPQKPAS